MDLSIENRFQKTADSKTFQNILNIHQLRNKRVLDIGCSSGEFLTHFGKGSVGISIKGKDAQYGKEKDLDIRTGNIESSDFSIGESFDVIFCNNLLEHLYSPHNFLMKIRKFLNLDGFLILGVPCIPQIVSLLRFRKFQGALAGEHVNFFMRDTLRKTVERGGWRVKYVRGYHFRNRIIDGMLNPIYPHFYVVAEPNLDHVYSAKRLNELAGYEQISISFGDS